jgi:hypothetical protein
MTHEKLIARRPAPGLVLRTAGVLVAGLLVTGPALAACGSVAAPGGSGGPGSGSPAAAPKASLTITVTNGPDRKVSHWTLRCGPSGGTHPDAAAACAALLALKNPFAPVRPGAICPQFLASARRATIAGTWFGTKVHRTIVDGGCDYSTWVRLAPVLK